MQLAANEAIKSQKKHMTICVPESMDTEVERFLKTDIAYSMGFDSKADVVTAAVRNLLLEYRQYGYFTK